MIILPNPTRDARTAEGRGGERGEGEKREGGEKERQFTLVTLMIRSQETVTVSPAEIG